MECEPGSDLYCYHVAFAIIDVETGAYQIIDNELTQSIGIDNQWEYKITWIDDENIQLSVGDSQIALKVHIPE